MANTTTVGANTITIVLDGSTDWSYETDTEFTEGIKVSSVQFMPSAINDVFIARDGSASGAILHDSGVVASVRPWYDPVDPPQWERLYIDATDLTLDTAASALVIIRFV